MKRFKIVFDPTTKLLKAIPIGHETIKKSREISGGITPQTNTPTEVSENEVQNMLGGKTPNFPKMTPPSGHTWGAIPDPGHNRLVILIPKPIIRTGPEGGRITGTTSSGKPIYGGYYQVSIETKGGEMPTYNEIMEAIDKHPAYKQAKKAYKEKGTEVLATRPLIIDVSNGQTLAFPKTKPTRSYKKTQTRQKGTERAVKTNHIAETLRGFPAEYADQWVYNINGKPHLFSIDDDGIPQMIPISTSRASEIRRKTGQTYLDTELAHAHPLAIWSTLILGQRLDRYPKGAKAISSVTFDPQAIKNILTALASDIPGATDGYPPRDSRGNLITGHYINQMAGGDPKAAERKLNNILYPTTGTYNLEAAKTVRQHYAPLKFSLLRKDGSVRRQKCYLKSVADAAAERADLLTTTGVEVIRQGLIDTVQDPDMRLAMKLNARGITMGQEEHIQGTGFKGLRSLTTDDISYATTDHHPPGTLRIEFTLFHSNTKAAIFIEPNMPEDRALIEAIEERVATIETSQSETNRLFPDLDPDRYAGQLRRLFASADPTGNMTTDVPVTSVDLARAGRLHTMETWLAENTNTLRAQGKLTGSSLLEAAAIHLQSQYGAGTTEAFIRSIPTKAKKAFLDTAKQLQLIKGLLEFKLRKAIATADEQVRRLAFGLSLPDDVYNDITLFTDPMDFIIEYGLNPDLNEPLEVED